MPSGNLSDGPTPPATAMLAIAMPSAARLEAIFGTQAAQLALRELGEAADALIRRLFERVEITPALSAAAKDAKTRLQEWLQGRKLKLPMYKVVATTGAAHQQSFDVECTVSELRLVERGIGGSRRAGEQAAAAAMLQTLMAKGG